MHVAPATEPTRSQLKALPAGPRGTRATLRDMARFVRAYRKEIPIRELALSIVRSVPGHKNFRGQIEALHKYVQNRIQYVQDIRDVETLQTPIKTLEYGQGDCDDQATLLAALLESVGFHTRFIAVQLQHGGPFVHVYAEVNLGRSWFPVETTERWPAGKGPGAIVVGRMIENI